MARRSVGIFQRGSLALAPAPPIDHQQRSSEDGKHKHDVECTTAFCASILIVDILPRAGDDALPSVRCPKTSRLSRNWMLMCGLRFCAWDACSSGPCVVCPDHGGLLAH
jgi:hypothetical protein